MLEEGQIAPDFELPADDGRIVRLSDLRGKRVILYFYPKDDTSGCTAQACEYRDALPQIEEAGAVVLGVSPDSIASHVKFKKKYNLNFPLLADEDHAVAEAYGVWKEKSMYGRTYFGIERSTFVIGEDGNLLRVARKVTAKGDADRAMTGLSA
jgi:peroxiredoxin Q/BCP